MLTKTRGINPLKITCLATLFLIFLCCTKTRADEAVRAGVSISKEKSISLIKKPEV